MAYVRKCKDRYNRKPVIQFSLKGDKIKEWNTVGEIFRELGLDKSAILRCCKGKQKRSYHFIWKFKEDCIVESQPNNNSMGNASDNEKLSGIISDAEKKIIS